MNRFILWEILQLILKRKISVEVCTGLFFRSGPSPARPELISYLPAQPGPLEKSRAGPGTGLASGSGPCRPLPQPFVRSCAWKVKTIIPLFIANTFLHNWMTYANFIQCKHIKIYFKIFHPLTIIYWNYFVRGCMQNICTIYTIVYRKRNLLVREIENSALSRPGPKQNTKFGPGPDCLGLSDFKTESFS